MRRGRFLYSERKSDIQYLKVEIMICLCKTLCSSTRAHFLARRSKGMNVIDLDGSDYN